MCGRFVSPEQAAIERAFGLGRRGGNPFPRRYNVYPTETIAFLRVPSNAREPELDQARWGFVPHWWKEAKPPARTHHIARVEEAAGKPMWRDAWSRSRCLVPAEGWYEWQEVERTDPATGEIRKAKQPHFVRRADDKLFCFAGLMSWWKHPRTGEGLRTCAILTAAADGSLADIHERAPMVLPESAYQAWLDRKLTDPAKVKAIADSHLPADAFAHWKVRLLVNNTDADGPELIEPVDED